MGISPYVGGRSAVAGRQNVIRLASNESALGPSPRAVTAYEAVGNSLHRYPDGGANDLRAALGELHGLDAARIVCGSGSDEILQLLAKAYAGPGDEVLYSRHGFLVYGLAARAVSAEPVAAPETDFRADVDALLAHVTEKTRILFLANPNNPTGSYLTEGELRRLWGGLPENILLVIDSAYAEYVTVEDYEAGADLVDRAKNVVMTRTFSKIYGLAALRLGWCYGAEEVIDVMNRVRGPFNVNLPAIEAGTAAIQDRDFLKKSKEHNDRSLAFLTQQLGGLGYDVTPSVCNFVLVHFPETPGKTADDANKFLAERGLIVRGVQPYGLPNALRISVGLEEHNRAVVEALEAFAKA